MKSFQTSSFQNVFHRLMSGEKIAPTATRWKVRDAEWTRERHSYVGPVYNFQLEVHRLTVPGPQRPWELMVVVERWWSGPKDEMIRSTYWTKLLGGKRTDALAWFQTRAKEFDDRG